ncbi:Hsp70 family protein [Opitutus sp. ER46]|uniref:Hsp70 family protein n=1 Tax=Opitutus sp. ER46 TaxID=2161864 RepID=UPI000D2FBD79|nr:Hsp70 family protein [Opitutus sp. ER46]PTX96653.1 molecular chaperone DnaK [Opitutus sp. ER46]
MAADFVVGIDLGTSNCAMAAAALASGAGATVTDFAITQLQRPGQAEARPLLPSCLYRPGAGEIAPGTARLPWGEATDWIVGEFARWQGARVPGRFVNSAKSWLCHAGVDRTAPILPWGAPADVEKISPMQASARLLAHLAAAWDAAHPTARLAAQEVVITVPASFDEVARALTVTAAREAGLEQFTLVEEPQAAFYDFTSRHRHDLADALAGVRLVLVVDVGGGTTDFTLIAVGVGDDGPVLKRIAVGEHLILGGDNMDAALARRAEERLAETGRKLNATQWTQLVQASRVAKEALLAVTAPERQPLALAGSGSRLIGGTLSTEVTRAEAEQLIVEGFFPACTPDEPPRRAARVALQELGLPYAQDAAITRHLAAFLRRHAAAGHAALGRPVATGETAAEAELPRPDAILLNGGVFNAPRLANRLVDMVSAWWPNQPRIPLLEHDSLDLAVARGAAAYGLARRGLGRKIGGGAAQALYIGLTPEDAGGDAQAVCVIPRGHEEGQTVDMAERAFQLTVGRPVQFPLFATTADRVDKPGDVVALGDDFKPLPPLHTLLQATAAKRGAVPVHLRSALTELGTLELWCVSNAADERWRLEFDLRGAASRGGATVTESMPESFGQVRELVERVFGPAPRVVEPREVKRFAETLEAALGPREAWSAPLLRELWSTLFAGAKRRRRSAVHERLFYRFVGYGLRPGFGYPLDDWRCEQTFALLTENVNFHAEVSVWNEFWVMWRRIAGGLTAEQHQAIWRVLEPHLARRIPPNATKNAGRVKGIQPEGLDEMVRTAAALERLEPAQKVVFGNWIVARLRTPGQSAAGPWAWALGRVGARVPLFGSSHQTIAPEAAAAWLELLLERGLREIDGAAFAAVQLARRTGDRTRDLDDTLRERTLEGLRAAKAPERWLQLVAEVVALESEDEARALGDTLPLGLKL